MLVLGALVALGFEAFRRVVLEEAGPGTRSGSSRLLRPGDSSRCGRRPAAGARSESLYAVAARVAFLKARSLNAITISVIPRVSVSAAIQMTSRRALPRK